MHDFLFALVFVAMAASPAIVARSFKICEKRRPLIFPLSLPI